MKEVQNKNHTDEAKRLNEELDQNLKDLQPESKEAFQGFEVKEEKNEKKKKAKKKKTPKQIIKRVIIVLAVIILLPCAAIVGMWALGKGSLFGGKMKMSKNVDGVNLKKYLVYTKKGDKLDAASYISKVCMGGDYDSDVPGDINKSKVKIKDEVDYDTPGSYEITYSVKSGKSRTGTVRLIVIVTE